MKKEKFTLAVKIGRMYVFFMDLIDFMELTDLVEASFTR